MRGVVEKSSDCAWFGTPRECVIERDEILVVGRKQEAKTYHLSFCQNVTPNSTRVDSPEPTDEPTARVLQANRFLFWTFDRPAILSGHVELLAEACPPRCDQVLVHSWRAIMSFRQPSASSRAIQGGFSPLSDGGQLQTVHFCLNVAYVLVLLGRHKTNRPPGFYLLERLHLFVGVFLNHTVRSSSRVFMTCHSSNLSVVY